MQLSGQFPVLLGYILAKREGDAPQTDTLTTIRHIIHITQGFGPSSQSQSPLVLEPSPYPAAAAAGALGKRPSRCQGRLGSQISSVNNKIQYFEEGRRNIEFSKHFVAVLT